MADEAAPPAPLDIEIEPQSEIAAESEPGNGVPKRAREEDEDAEQNGEKRIKAESDKGSGEEREESLGDGEEKIEEPKKEEEEETTGASVGMKTFASSVEMFDYFYKILHTWPANINLNQYEHIMMLELLKKGHLEAERKIGCGINAFQVRFHPQFKSRCFFLIRDDESTDDFSFRKCVDHILPLPENMQIKHDVNKALRGKGGGFGRGHGRGRGRGNRGRGRK